ncbi:MAG: HesB/IscA family protein [Promethearchaeota archaeon]
MEQKHAEINNDKLSITENAADKLKEILSQQTKEEVGLRIKALPGGCAGVQYRISIEDKKIENDTTFEVAGIKFYVDSNSINLVRGAKIDFLGGIRFKITNPAVETACGCGGKCSL